MSGTWYGGFSIVLQQDHTLSMQDMAAIEVFIKGGSTVVQSMTTYYTLATH